MVMPATGGNPLSEQDKEALDVALAECANCKSMIARAEQAGIDVSDMKARLAEFERVARGIKGAFFPNQ